MVLIFGEGKATEKYVTPVKEKNEKNEKKLVKNEDENFEHLEIMTFISVSYTHLRAHET